MMIDEYTKFLQQVESLNDKYASIYLNCELEPLVMPFWSWQQIQDGLALREEWEVDPSLVPFYGDWHDLFCLQQDSGEIVALDDSRRELCRWASIRDFISSLSVKEIEFDDDETLRDDSVSDEDASAADAIERAIGLRKKH